eukprot:1054472-Rhodomonas_salina.1
MADVPAAVCANPNRSYDRAAEPPGPSRSRPGLAAPGPDSATRNSRLQESRLSRSDRRRDPDRGGSGSPALAA